MITIAEILEYLEHEETKRSGWGNQFVDTEFETMPDEFISFAEEDLETSNGHKYINALSNAKRALDCQTDRLLKLLGFYKESQTNFGDFQESLKCFNHSKL